MGGKSNDLQDRYLNSLRKERIPVTIFLTNGARIKGVIRSFDNFVILIKQEKLDLVYKHAISTIVPERDVDIKDENTAEEKS